MRTTNTQDASKRIKKIISKAVDGEDAADAIAEEYVLIPRADLPEVSEGPHEGYVKTATLGGTFESAFYRGAPEAHASDPVWHMNHARHHIAIAGWLEAYKSAAGKAKRDARRNELAREMSYAAEGFSLEYGVLGLTTQLAIDKIIDLEEAAS